MADKISDKWLFKVLNVASYVFMTNDAAKNKK